MALDVVLAVEEAERKAVQMRDDAKAEAAELIAKAELDGKACIEEAKTKANLQIAQIKADLDKQVEDGVDTINSETGSKQKELVERAQSRMDSAVNMIKERIIVE